MNAQFKKGILEMCVLVLLKNQDRYGYELIQLISDKFAISEGAIYPVLHRLTKEHFFETYKKKSTEGPTRKYYHLTEEGRVRLQRLIADWNSFSAAVDTIILEETGDEKENGSSDLFKDTRKES